MEFITELQTAHFWAGLGLVVWVNVILSADNAVVIALAALSLPKHQQRSAIVCGAGAAVVVRIALTLVAVEMLKLPFLKLIGGLLLFWIAVKLLSPDDGDPEIKRSDNLIEAIWIILIADLAMSVDNVLAVAAAVKGSTLVLVLGLGISIPLVIVGAAVLMKLMERFPIIVVIGAALIGAVAGELLVTDPLTIGWIGAHMPWMAIHLPLVGEISWAQLLGAALVVIVGKWIAARAAQAAASVQLVDLAAEDPARDTGIRG